MPEILKATVLLEITAAEVNWGRIDDLLKVLDAVRGVERWSITDRLEVSRSLTIEVDLAGPDQKKLRSLYQRVSKLVSSPPLRLRNRSCDLHELFG